MNDHPTIVGLATGTPDGGVSVVRISGPQAGPILCHLVGSLPKPRRLTFSKVSFGSGSKEEILAVWMPGPASFTGEDVVELHIHAGVENTREALAAVLEQGAQAAQRGEFTRRAFANAKLTLDQAEGIAALIGAQTQEALHQARRLVAGELGRSVEKIRGQIWDLCCEVEANLDFPEDVDTRDVARWSGEVRGLVEILGDWSQRFEDGRRARECARFVLAGPPNAGKSALFNRLLGRSRSIVSEVPGTTRDYVEAQLSFGPHRAVLVDTAGVRDDVADKVEGEGVGFSREQIAGADLVIWVESATVGNCKEVPDFESTTVLRVENKRDLATQRTDWHGLSAQTGAGCESLLARLGEWFTSRNGGAWIGLERHRNRAIDAREAVAEAERLLAEEAGLELVAFSLNVARRRLDEITGRSDLGP
ncbi:MAG: tRNA modification GTPase, partial [Nannocystaceae bacterium]